MAGKVGFVGLGNMGGPMALNLVKAGFELAVHDINPDRLAPLTAAGASVVPSPAAAAAECRRTICMVETTDQAEAVILGGSGFIQSARQGDIVVCMSTIDPLAARRFAERLAEKGVAMLDAPVSGGPHGAVAGTLSVIVGGPAETFAAAEDLFSAMGRNVFHVGGHGLGLAMKLINNMLGQIQTVAIAEAMVLGKKAGLDPRKIYEVVSASTGNSVQFQNRVPGSSPVTSRRAGRSTFPTRTRTSKRASPRGSACRCSWPIFPSRSTRWAAPPDSTRKTARRSSRYSSGWRE